MFYNVLRMIEPVRWMLRGLWLFTAVLVMVILVSSIPLRYSELQEVLHTQEFSGRGNWQLVPIEVETLQAQGFSLTTYAAYIMGVEILFAIGFLLVAIIIFWRKSDEWFAVMVSLTLMTYGITGTSLSAVLGKSYPELWHWPIETVQAVGTAGIPLLFFLFPNGRFVPRWSRPLALAWIGLVCLWLFFPRIPFNMIYGQTWGQTPVGSFIFALVLFNVGSFSQFYRYLRVSNQEQRQQTKWVVFGFAAIATAGLVLYVPGLISPAIAAPGSLSLLNNVVSMPLASLLALLLPISIAMAILRYRLWDIDIIINRALVYGSLTAVIVVVYILVVGSLGVLLQTEGSLLISLVATSLVAVMFHPLRERLQKSVNRLMFGEQEDVADVLLRLGQRLEAAVTPNAILPALVETVAHTLKSPYVAIQVTRGDDLNVAASYGELVPKTESFPLIYQTETVGYLVVAPRAPGEALRPADVRLLSGIAHQTGAAVHAMQLTVDLQQSRQRLVTTREEERRRLRRDLHDGLGPTLAAHILKVGFARQMLDGQSDTVQALLATLESDLKGTLGEVRRLVYNLRPPALDQLGLVGAIQAFATEYNLDQKTAETRLAVRVEVPAPLPRLSAAVEVAAYRIIQEALTNVVHHAQATTCTIHLAAIEQLEIKITDDGRGLPASYRAGVGLTSMRERAAELGGICFIYALPAGGTCVHTALPLAEELA